MRKEILFCFPYSLVPAFALPSVMLVHRCDLWLESLGISVEAFLSGSSS